MMMASYEFDPKTGRARLFFRYNGRQLNRTINVPTDRAADNARALVEETIQDLKRGKLAMPADADPADFLLSGGKVVTKPRPVETQEAATEVRTLGQVFATYAEMLTPGSKESNSLCTEAIHRRHFVRLIGEGAIFETLGIDKIQKYVDTRAKEGVVRETIRKELSTLRVIWGWAQKRRHVSDVANWKMKDLTFPKSTEKPPFQTWTQIERKVARGGLSESQQAELWASLWLDQSQTLECLGYVREHSGRPFLHAMFAFAAYTGARRSEMIRSERDDWDFKGKLVVIRQKKADRSKTYTRRSVPIHPDLSDIMQAWFNEQPGETWTLCMPDGRPIIPQAATDYFRVTLEPGKWRVLHGFHVFRHSLASNMASAGTDQRVISEILGHHTEDMERRYRHLLPQKQEHALNSLFKPTADT
jgi:integrase